MFSRIEVNGINAHSLFKYLKDKLPGLLREKIKWNFTKFLIDRNGNPVKRFPPTTEPLRIVKNIEDLLK
jgi:glutathione peroxidase